METQNVEAGAEHTFVVNGAEYDVTVEYNTIGSPEDHMFGSEKMKAHTSKGRNGLDITVGADGSAEIRPRFNGNGQVERGELEIR